MKILVLNGSPKGDLSVTIQYVLFIRKKFPQHELKTINISQQIKALENKDGIFEEVIEEVSSADGILWAFPVYFLLVPSSYKRFIELIWERGSSKAFIGKYTASLSTSIHFYDHLAHDYINAVCDDLGMKYIDGFSAEMEDLMEKQERRRLSLFAEHLFDAITNCTPTSKNFRPLAHQAFEYVPGPMARKVSTRGKKVIVLTDRKEREVNVKRMIQSLTAAFSEDIEVINLHEIDIKGGCLGCIQCAYDNRCTYGDQDGYVEFFEKKIRPADILVFAGSIKDRYLSSRWKLFLDRSFFNNHVPVMKGKQLGFLISGPLSQTPNLKQALVAFYEIQQAGIVDFVTDEFGNSEEIDLLLQSLAQRLIRYSDEDYKKPPSFLSIGGKKIFRDNVYSRLRFPFRADHKYYKRNGLYDFPQKKYKTRIINACMTILCTIPSIRKEIYGKRMKEEMVKPLKKIVEKE